MPTQIHAARLLELIREYGYLEVWTNQDPYRYCAGKVLIGQEGDRDTDTIRELLRTGFLKLVSVAINCRLYQLTPEGESFIRNNPAA